MNTMLEQAGIAGAVLAGIAYLPQIWHMIHERCTYGISLSAFSLWLVAAILITIHAVAIHAAAFILLGFIQISATAIIVVYTLTHRSAYCPFHFKLERAARRK